MIKIEITREDGQVTRIYASSVVLTVPFPEGRDQLFREGRSGGPQEFSITGIMQAQMNGSWGLAGCCEELSVESITVNEAKAAERKASENG